MLHKDRLKSIKQIIQIEKKVTVSELRAKFQVTTETIRRDLARLESDGILTRTHGGAVMNSDSVIENSSFILRANHQINEKRIIAELVRNLIPKSAVIASDASSTSVEAVRLLRDEPDITVLTNSTQILNESYGAAFRIVSTGGAVNTNTFSMQGRIARDVLRSLYADIVILSCKALSMTGVIFDSNEDEAEIKKIMAERGQKIILLADHSKFDKVAFVKLTDIEKLDVLVTDREPSDEWKNLLHDKNVTLIY